MIGRFYQSIEINDKANLLFDKMQNPIQVEENHSKVSERKTALNKIHSQC